MSASVEPAWSWPHLHEAQRIVLSEVLVHGARSRAALARRTGMSRTSLTRLSRDLVELGLVVEGETVLAPARGRPSELLDVRPNAAHFAGIKLTGDSLYAAVTDLRAKTVTTMERRLESRAVGDVVDLIGEVVAELRADYPRICAVGVCLAGDVVTDNGLRRLVGSHFLGWEDVPLAELVAARTDLPAQISNDVQALTAAHHWFGAGVGQSSLALIGLGAGVGVGLVVGDEPVRGSRGHPGKVGHLRLSDSGPTCDRGHVGCVSAYVTIPAVVQNSGRVDFAGVLAAADAGDERSQQALRSATWALGAVIAHLANLFDPARVIVTGEGLPIATYDEALLEETITAHLDPAAEAVDLDLHPFDFSDYAWAAAISAIRLVL